MMDGQPVVVAQPLSDGSVGHIVHLSRRSPMRSISSRTITFRYVIAVVIIAAVLLAPAFAFRPALAAENAPDSPSAGLTIYLPLISMEGGGTGSDGEAVSPPIVFDPCGNPMPDGGTVPATCDPPPSDDQ